ncbi:MAG: CPBP family intramembrane glutamic endopeptidase [Bacillota bacterium]|nr:CPBP family intramembrane glutamic endopeptidase [Bacillota bacterium]
MNEVIDDRLQLKPGLDSAMRLYLFVFLLLLVLGSIFQSIHFELGMIATQWGLILPPALWYWSRYRVDKAEFARLRGLKLVFIPPIIILSASFWILNMGLAAALVTGLMELGYQPITVIEPPKSLAEYLTYIAVLSFSAGICEEFLFRGTIMPAMEDRGKLQAVVFSSFLFALYHVSFTNLLSTFILGLVMAVIVIKTGSLWGGILYHMLNNFYAATYLYAAGNVEATAETDPGSFLVLMPLFILALGGVFWGMRILNKRTHSEPLFAYRSGWLPRGWFKWPLAISLILYLVMALIEFALGFSWFEFNGF